MAEHKQALLLAIVANDASVQIQRLNGQVWFNVQQSELLGYPNSVFRAVPKTTRINSMEIALPMSEVTGHLVNIQLFSEGCPSLGTTCYHGAKLDAQHHYQALVRASRGG